MPVFSSFQVTDPEFAVHAALKPHHFKNPHCIISRMLEWRPSFLEPGLFRGAVCPCSKAYPRPNALEERKSASETFE